MCDFSPLTCDSTWSQNGDMIFRQSIGPLSPQGSFARTWGAGADPSCHWARDGGTGRPPITRPRRQTTVHSHSHTYRQFKVSPINPAPICMSSGQWEEREERRGHVQSKLDTGRHGIRTKHLLAMRQQCLVGSDTLTPSLEQMSDLTIRLKDSCFPLRC